VHSPTEDVRPKKYPPWTGLETQLLNINNQP
jgi:hypothetical protein